VEGLGAGISAATKRTRAAAVEMVGSAPKSDDTALPTRVGGAH
jgi:hypothetical protein